MMFNFHYKINCRQSYSYACAVNNEGFFMGPTEGPSYYNFAWVPHTFGGGLTPADLPLFRALVCCTRDIAGRPVTHRSSVSLH